MLGHEAEQFGREIVLEERLAGVARKPGFIEVKQSEMKSSPVQLGSVTWSVIKHPVEGRAIEGGREVCRTRLREELDVRGADEPADTRGAESASEEKLVDCERLRTEKRSYIFESRSHYTKVFLTLFIFTTIEIFLNYKIKLRLINKPQRNQMISIFNLKASKS